MVKLTNHRTAVFKRAGEVAVPKSVLIGQFGGGGVGKFLQLAHLAAADQRGGLHFRTRLEDLACDDGARAGGQLREFAKRFRGGGGSGAAPPFKSGEDGFFGRLLERNRLFWLPGLP